MYANILAELATDQHTAERVAAQGVMWYASHGYFSGNSGKAASTLLRLWRTRHAYIISASIDGELKGAMVASKALSHYGEPILQQIHVTAWCETPMAQVRVLQALHVEMRRVAGRLGCVECVSCSALDTATQFQRMLLKIGWERVAPRSLASRAPASPSTVRLGARQRPRPAV